MTALEERLTTLCAVFISLLVGAAEAGTPHRKPNYEVPVTIALLKAADALPTEDALTRAAALTDPLARDLVRRAALRRAPIRFWRDQLALAADRPDWPGAYGLRVRGEAGAFAAGRLTAPDVELLSAAEPVTSAGVIAILEALRAGRRNADARALARRAWRETPFRSEREKRFLACCKRFLRRSDHRARLDRLLWEGERFAAARQLRRTKRSNDADDVRLDFMNRRRSAEESFTRLSERERRDAGLAFERARFLRRADRNLEAAGALIDAAGALNEPPPAARRWRVERDVVARRLIAAGENAIAYKVAAGHGLLTGVDFAEAEFLAGWIALRRLGRPDLAETHFARLEDGVHFAVSRAKAAYWRARAAEATGDYAAAAAHYRRAAATPDVFYGRLAADRTPGGGTATERSDHEGWWTDEKAARAIALLIDAGRDDDALAFVRWAVKAGVKPGALAALADKARTRAMPHVAVRLSKAAARFGGATVAAGMPAPPLVLREASARLEDPALLLAHARQESEFDPDAVSHAKARGMMQFIRSTARATARRAGLPYRGDRLTGDPVYSARLGAAHIAELLERFDGAYLLEIAAYNAGARAVERWLRTYGDPRDPDVDPLDWIELIPYSETRSYVHRVLENVVAYRARLGVPHSALMHDLKRGVRYANAAGVGQIAQR